VHSPHVEFRMSFHAMYAHVHDTVGSTVVLASPWYKACDEENRT
jgi:hypothetical protein